MGVYCASPAPPDERPMLGPTSLVVWICCPKRLREQCPKEKETGRKEVANTIWTVWGRDLGVPWADHLSSTLSKGANSVKAISSKQGNWFVTWHVEGTNG